MKSRFAAWDDEICGNNSGRSDSLPVSVDEDPLLCLVEVILRSDETQKVK